MAPHPKRITRMLPFTDCYETDIVFNSSAAILEIQSRLIEE
jgi:hypothetical protein